MRPEEITIAVTVYDRSQYILDAVRSALKQSLPVRVIVVEDCGPNSQIRQEVEHEFGNRIQYFRNSKRRGLFDNWNACLEFCKTEWLSILHDDDLLLPHFIQDMMSLHSACPGMSLYFGSSQLVDYNMRAMTRVEPPAPKAEVLNLQDFATKNLVLFPGQIMLANKAVELGGFNPHSMFTGDWDMWFKLALSGGAARSTRTDSYCRVHEGLERGTNKVMRDGRKFALDFVQIKRNLRLLHGENSRRAFNRKEILSHSQIPIKYLLQTACGFNMRKLNYHVNLLLLSPSMNLRYAVFKYVAALLGARFAAACSRVYTRLQS